MDFYKIAVAYPDGHTDSLEDIFRSLEEAVETGKNLLGQISYTERMHETGRSFDGFDTSLEPYFIVRHITDKEHKIVFDSRVSK